MLETCIHMCNFSTKGTENSSKCLSPAFAHLRNTLNSNFILCELQASVYSSGIDKTDDVVRKEKK